MSAPAATTRKVVAGLFISLDGVVEDPETWHFPYVDDELMGIVGNLSADSDALLLGRVTYEAFAATWPYQSGAMAEALNSIPKLVASTTLTHATWNNSSVMRGDVVGEVDRLKRQPGKNIGVSGSIKLTQVLMSAGLVDELHLMLHPVILGTGRRLFTNERIPLQLAASKSLSTGVVHLHYRPE